MAVPFALGSVTHAIPDTDIRFLRQSSLKLRRLLADPRPPGPVYLPPDRERGIDGVSIQYLLDNLGLDQHPERPVNITDLSGQCNALHDFGCDPRPFAGLWARLEKRWGLAPRPPGAWCWRLPRRKDISFRRWTHYAIAAWVLEQDDEFSDVMRSLVFDSKVDRLATAVEDLRDIKEHRDLYMRRIFHVLVEYVKILNDNRSTRSIGRQMLDRISESPHLNIHLTGSLNEARRPVPAWDRSSADLSTRTIYGFVLQLDIALLRGTSEAYNPDDYAPPEPAASLHESDDASVLGVAGPKSLDRLRVTKAFKEVWAPKREYVEEVKRMMNMIDNEILEYQAELVGRLIRNRNRIMEERRVLLQAEPSPSPAVPQGNGHPPELPAEIGQPNGHG
ncbi:hypothetical protein B0T16DRAFT_422603 [Cercophora newfieldiana]|uniref:Uncharacterized protein n=1 Tax=Cercophora newfieldiana TaxID=92897 RepID=A0AA39XU78_9PEZI|nr:hypothetical protein B0T16DRAFT_422603 [Cercophora newfieldiana]